LLANPFGQVIRPFTQGWVGQGQQVQTCIEPAREALDQVGVAEERQQGWRQPDGDPRGLCGIASSRLKHLKQWEVALQQGLEEPIFLKRPWPG